MRETKTSAKLLGLFTNSDPKSEDSSPRLSGYSSPGYSSDRSNYQIALENSPNYATQSPYVKSPWTHSSNASVGPLSDEPSTGLIGSMIREQGHLYSIAAADGLLYTGSDSKNIRVWKNLQEHSGFKSGSGLVKAIIVSGDRVFTGHQDGKIRIWKLSHKNDSVSYKRIGTLPRLKDFIKSSINPSAYVQVRRHKNKVWLRHFDAVSCMALDEEAGLLYSGSWDKTFKVWRVSDSKCLESVHAHDDAINSMALLPYDGIVLTGSADGTVKMWRRETKENGRTKHVLERVLLRKESAVTAIAVSEGGDVAYCGSSDGEVNFWEMKGRRLVYGGVLMGHKKAVLCVVSVGRLVISGSADRTIRIWRRGKGGDHMMLSVLTGHGGPIKCLAVEKERGDNGTGGNKWVLYSGSLDKSVMVWHVADNSTHLPKFDDFRYRENWG